MRIARMRLDPKAGDSSDLFAPSIVQDCKETGLKAVRIAARTSCDRPSTDSYCGKPVGYSSTEVSHFSDEVPAREDRRSARDP